MLVVKIFVRICIKKVMGQVFEKTGIADAYRTVFKNDKKLHEAEVLNNISAATGLLFIILAFHLYNQTKVFGPFSISVLDYGFLHFLVCYFLRKSGDSLPFTFYAILFGMAEIVFFLPALSWLSWKKNNFISWIEYLNYDNDAENFRLLFKGFWVWFYPFLMYVHLVLQIANLYSIYKYRNEVMFNRTMLLKQLKEKGSFYRKVKKYFDHMESNEDIGDFSDSEEESLENNVKNRKSNAEKEKTTANNRIKALNEERNLVNDVGLYIATKNSKLDRTESQVLGSGRQSRGSGTKNINVSVKDNTGRISRGSTTKFGGDVESRNKSVERGNSNRNKSVERTDKNITPGKKPPKSNSKLSSKITKPEEFSDSKGETQMNELKKSKRKNPEDRLNTLFAQKTLAKGGEKDQEKKNSKLDEKRREKKITDNKKKATQKKNDSDSISDLSI